MNKNWRDLIRPKRLEVEADSLTPQFGKFFAEPFERGFGVTIGNTRLYPGESVLQMGPRFYPSISGISGFFTVISALSEHLARNVQYFNPGTQRCLPSFGLESSSFFLTSVKNHV